MNLQLTGKIALVTGSTAGIGHAIAKALAVEGASVILNGRTQAAVDEAVAALQSPTTGKVLGFAGDVSNAATAAQLLQRHPHIDILVNNLGIFEAKSFEEITDADWLRFFDVNVLSGARLARLCLPGMRSRNWGRIIFISSESAFHIPPDMVHYGMTKAAQIAVARGLAEAVAGTGITVNSLLPGPTRSRGVNDFLGAASAAAGISVAEVEAGFIANHRPTSLLKRFTTADEVAAMAAFIASPLSAATTGAAVRVDGGVIKSAF